jgi:hypothetical protein
MSSHENLDRPEFGWLDLRGIPITSSSWGLCPNLDLASEVPGTPGTPGSSVPQQPSLKTGHPNVLSDDGFFDVYCSRYWVVFN